MASDNRYYVKSEEAIGTAHDFWTAYREGAYGEIPRPFVGWFMLVEDASGSRTPIKDASPNFPVFPEFKNASYIARYDILCKKLVQEQLYTTATVLTSPRSAIETGEYQNLSELTGLMTFVNSFADHIAAESARSQS